MGARTLVELLCPRSRQTLLLVLALLISLILSSCATLVAPGAEDDSVRQELQWPSLPLSPRIVWVKEIRDYQDIGISKSVWQRVRDVFTGATKERIGKPYGVLFDDRDRLVVVDVAFSEVHLMDVREKRYSVIGGEGVFRSPIGVTEDDQENLYITDAGAGTIYRYNLKKEKLEPFIISDVARPTGIAFNRKNRLVYVTDTTEHQVVVYDLHGNFRFRIGSRGESTGHFNYPTDIFIDRSGILYVTDALNSRVSVFSADGQHLRSFGRAGDTIGSFAKPKGIASDSAGNIYVVDALLDAVQIFNQKGELLLNFGVNGTAEGQFWMPSGIFIDSNDYIYVADSYNRRVQVFKYLHVEEAPFTPATSKPKGAVIENVKP